VHGESVFGVDKGSRVGEISLYIMSIVASCVVVGGEDEIWEERTKSGRRGRNLGGEDEIWEERTKSGRRGRNLGGE